MAAPYVEPTPQRDARTTLDAALLAGIGLGSREALAEAYRRHAGAMLAVACRLLPESEQAEEVVRQVFLHLWRSPTEVSPGAGSLRADLVAECHRRSVDRLRASGAHGAGQDAPVEHHLVGDALAVLSPDERDVIETAYFGGHTYRETATMLGRPEAVVKDWMRSGMVRLRQSGGPRLSA